MAKHMSPCVLEYFKFCPKTRTLGLELLLLSSRSVMSNPLRPHGLQHARPPCPSPSPGICSNSCPLSHDDAV